MKIIGVTGLVCTGKSTFLNWMEEKGKVKICKTDDINRELCLLNDDVKDAISKEFGDELVFEYDNNKFLNTCYLYRILFEKKENLEKMQNIMIPFVTAEVKKLIEECKEKYDYFFLESAILFIAKLDMLCDLTLWIDNDIESVVKLLKEKRSNWADYVMEMIIDIQKENIWQKDKCDFVIENIGNLEEFKNKSDLFFNKISERS
ncbi:dephospho-CoA kinase [Candidatus Pacearchaeota archaeon]|nr:dephospho-CoA kinase [bacterium]MCK9597044.1 dephospho-CoA kinase [Candidatus Pacearchaeota archaeon]